MAVVICMISSVIGFVTAIFQLLFFGASIGQGIATYFTVSFGAILCLAIVGVIRHVARQTAREMPQEDARATIGQVQV